MNWNQSTAEYAGDGLLDISILVIQEVIHPYHLQVMCTIYFQLNAGQEEQKQSLVALAR